MKIDLIIPFHRKDTEVIRFCIESCIENITNIGTIYLVTREVGKFAEGVKLIHEDEFFAPPLSKRYIASRWKREFPEYAHRASWLYQQFIKIGAPSVLSNLTDYYLVVDSDVVFLRPLECFRNGKMLLAKSREDRHLPYFECYERLFRESPDYQLSFISHYMIIKKSIMLEILRKLESTFNNPWYEAILDNIDYRQTSNFSEYELYGNYLRIHYPHDFQIKKVSCLEDFEKIPIIKNYKGKADYLALHSFLRERKKRRCFWDKLCSSVAKRT